MKAEALHRLAGVLLTPWLIPELSQFQAAHPGYQNQGHVHRKWKIRRLVSTLHPTFERMYRPFVLQTIIDFSFCTLQIRHYHRKVQIFHFAK